MNSTKLSEFMSTIPRQPFDWSAWNCCSFANSWLMYALGKDALAGLPAPVDLRSALGISSEFGDSFEAAVTKRTGLKPIPVAMARIGDLVQVTVKSSETLGSIGICNGRTSFFLSDTGLVVSLLTLDATHAWRLE